MVSLLELLEFKGNGISVIPLTEVKAEGKIKE